MGRGILLWLLGVPLPIILSAGDVFASLRGTSWQKQLSPGPPSRWMRESLAAKSAASWPSIIAGAFVAAAATVILIALGSGIGFASISPWPDRGASLTTFAMTTAIWLIVTQWISAALGGYIAGRLRTRWMGTHAHEVFFRDTAHGLITWAVATILVAAVGAGSFMSAASAARRRRSHDRGSRLADVANAPNANSPVSAVRDRQAFQVIEFRWSLHRWQTRAWRRRTLSPTRSSAAASPTPTAPISSSR